MKQYCKNIQGGIATTFAISLLLILTVVGGAFDLHLKNEQALKLQDALDMAVLAGVGFEGDEDEQLAFARTAFNSNVDQHIVGSDLMFKYDGELLKGSVRLEYSTALLSIVAISTLEEDVIAAAKNNREGALRCMHALNPSASASLLLNSKPRSSDVYPGASLEANGCTVQVDSNSPAAVLLKAGEFASGNNCFVGGWNTPLKPLTPLPETSCLVLGDPFATHSMYFPSMCTKPIATYGGTNITLDPGVYCNGLSASADNITFNPGVYYISSGSLDLDATGEIYGDGVSFVLSTSSGGFSIDANTIHLKAAALGDSAAFIIYDKSGSSTSPTPASSSAKKKKKKKKKSSGNEIRFEEYAYLEGIFYAPNKHMLIRWRRPATDVSPYWNAAQTPFVSFIADTLDFHGYSKFTLNYDPANTDLPVPNSLFGKSVGNEPRLVY